MCKPYYLLILLGVNLMGNPSFLLSGYIFIGTTFGALLSYLILKIEVIKIQYLYILCGGIIIGILIFDLIPHSINEYRLISVLLGILVGAIGCIIIHQILHNITSYSERSRLSILIAIMLHTIPIGLAIGSSLTSDLITSSLLLTLLIHQIPEGIVLMISFRRTGRKFVSFLVACLLLSLLFLVSSFIGGKIVFTYKLMGVLLGVAIGFLGFTAIKEFIIDARKGISNVLFVILSVSGASFVLLLHQLFSFH